MAIDLADELNKTRDSKLAAVAFHQNVSGRIMARLTGAASNAEDHERHAKVATDAATVLLGMYGIGFNLPPKVAK